jgi:hypothetical protein
VVDVLCFSSHDRALGTCAVERVQGMIDDLMRDPPSEGGLDKILRSVR